MATVATAFGLDVHLAEPLLLLAGARARPTGRRLDLSLAGDPEQPWPTSAETVCDQRERDGGISFRIESAPDVGYLIWGPAYGRHLLSRDGRRALCMPDGLTEGAWQRLLVAQTLPFAAVLRGLEVFHASAVVLAGGTIGLLGPSGAGKTSLALALCRQGATFLADDVLVLERSGQELLAHPGSPVAGVDHGEARRLEEQQANGHAPLASNERERLMAVPGAEQPAPLAALLLLQRSPDGPSRPQFEPLVGGAPLLAATFNTVLSDAERLRDMLELCALAARRPVERVLAGPAVDAARLADAVLERFAGTA